MNTELLNCRKCRKKYGKCSNFAYGEIENTGHSQRELLSLDDVLGCGKKGERRAFMEG